MARSVSPLADPSADAAAILRRLGFATLFFAIPMSALFARRAVVILAPLAVILLVLAAALDGSAKHLGQKLGAVVTSRGGVAGAVLLLWTVLALIWTPFLSEASERLLNIVAMALMALAGYLALPDRMRSANLYILPVGVGLAALTGMTMALRGSGGFNQDGQSFERGMILLVLLLWPAVTWLHSRGRNLEAMVLAIIVALGALFADDTLALQGLAVGALIFAVTAFSPRFGTRLTALAMAGLLLFAPALPFLLKPLAESLLGAKAPLVASLETWRLVVLDDPLRLITGHGLETSLRGRLHGLVPPAAPHGILFEVWYELGLVGAVAGAVLLYRSVLGAGGHRPILGPGIVAAFATAFALGCSGIGTAQVWWFTALVVVVLVFVAIERGQFRTKRPKAILRPIR
ncbi:MULTISPECIES: peptide ABC transporter permease [Microvirga]|uniref:peptide ABC transporter permease n=1 Tax=Microvirga TaxID=186650 RepID=UPI001CFFF706|nr:peptide ABC transporter permease [Microvirga lenta]MCB5175027.1 peptide ABC transporter permease [Microvirga lenta]